jgi:hypothetical protein
MRKTIRTIGIASLFLGGLAATSQLYAHKQSKPSMGQNMMQGGGMGGMMEQMSKMMGLCTKMMESTMDGTGGNDKNQRMTPPAEPEKKS